MFLEIGYPIVAKVTYYRDGVPMVKHTTYVLLYAHSLGEVVNAIEDDYFPNVEKVEAQYVADEGYVFTVPEHIAERIIKGEGDYIDGCKELPESGNT